MDLDDLSGKTALVTGGSRGIGRAIVRRLAGAGAAVVFSYVRDSAAAACVVDEGASPGRVWPVRADVADLTQLEALFAAARTHFDEVGFDGLDILVNNAGIVTDGRLGAISEADYDAVMAVNAKAVLFATQLASPMLHDGGRVVNVSSMTTAYATPGEAVYAASKAAVEQFTKVTAKELGARGITVNAVAPGPIDTAFLHAAVPAEAVAGVAQMTPLGRLGRPDDIAEVVAFLASPAADWVTGQCVHANGGIA